MNRCLQGTESEDRKTPPVLHKQHFEVRNGEMEQWEGRKGGGEEKEEEERMAVDMKETQCQNFFKCSCS